MARGGGTKAPQLEAGGIGEPISLELLQLRTFLLLQRQLLLFESLFNDRVRLGSVSLPQSQHTRVSGLQWQQLTTTRRAHRHSVGGPRGSESLTPIVRTHQTQHRGKRKKERKEAPAVVALRSLDPLAVVRISAAAAAAYISAAIPYT